MVANVIANESEHSARHESNREAADSSAGILSSTLHRKIYRIAFLLSALCLLAVLPALGHMRVSTVLDWSHVVLLGSLWQWAFIGWMVTVPDRGSLWVLMLVFVTAATSYGVVAGIALAMADEYDLPLGLASARWPAFWWSSLMLLVFAAAAFYCGHTAQRWRKGCRHGS
jgi:hypothetical protein